MENVWSYPDGYRIWMVRHIPTGIGAVAEAREPAEKEFDRIWGKRAPYRIILGQPPRPPRRGIPPSETAIPARISDDAFSRALHAELNRFHADHNPPGTTWSCDHVVAAIIRLRDAHDACR